MLNVYFVFGVPACLLFIYFIFAYIRKRSTIHYLGIILFIISSFMLMFNLQTWQQATTELAYLSSDQLSDRIGYPVYLIWLPIAIATCLVLLNLFRAWRRIRQLRENKA
ncbi:hypothetical protein A5844_000153 [Enterococcus sp. 10A9_DIV0425]|uniref:Integral membrane protein n=1 Tax=Candidatus Enterococcus wittei TaxID=1987383 RepID=A0A2C9XQ14_9ENTE|nr:hypothetical protein [Enterococcus sp. 10A9_DIV0425]OTP11938.1 hypothetical protein A5844_000153 [Enterococcus sp. 10A9_DIV0425]THE15999.1 hypothetical protein E1H99_01250 [Enterococcus hirae]